jgi:hypothetical protein
MVIIHAYTPLHLLQLDYLIEEYIDCPCTLIIPEILVNNVEKYKRNSISILCYSKMDASSYKSVFMSDKARFILSGISFAKVTQVILPDVSYTFNNYLASRCINSNSNVQIVFYFDGMLSILNSPISWQEIFKDFSKYILSRFVISGDIFYIKRKKQRSGVDLSLCSVQLSIAKNNILTYKNKVEVVPNLINFPNVFTANNDVIVFIVEDAKVIMPQYMDLFHKTISFLTDTYPNYQIKLLLRNRDHFKFFEKNTLIVRDFIGESAESVISKISPKIVISHSSTVLLNMSLTKYKGQVLSFKAIDFAKLTGGKVQVVNEMLELYRSLSIKVI